MSSQHQMWAARYHRTTKPRLAGPSGGLGTMGFGCPLRGMGAQLAIPTPDPAHRRRRLIQMNIQRASCRRWPVSSGLPINDLRSSDNGYLGMVRRVAGVLLPGAATSDPGCAARLRQAGQIPDVQPACGQTGRRIEAPRPARTFKQERSPAPSSSTSNSGSRADAVSPDDPLRRASTPRVRRSGVTGRPHHVETPEDP